jgi:hypothetical protein
MGQRLNIEIIDNNGVLANAYYHWSAYTTCSIKLVKKIVANSNIMNDFTNNKIIAIKLLEATGATLSTKEWEWVISNPNLNTVRYLKDDDRNSGLIGVTPNEIESNEKYAEHTITINIDSKTVDIRDMFSIYFTMKDYMEQEDEYREDDIHMCNIFPLSDIPFDKISEIYDIIYTFTHNKIYRVKRSDGIVLCFIE